MGADVLSSCMLTLLAGCVVAYLVWGRGQVPSAGVALTVVAWLLGTGLLGGVTGVWVARNFGWYPRWLAGALFGASTGLICLWVFVFSGA